MNRIRKWIRFFFGFSRTETNGFLVLLPLLFAILFSEPVYRWMITGRNVDFTTDKNIADSLIARWETVSDTVLDKGSAFRSARKPVFFQFDPNTATRKQFVELGLSGKLADRISAYRSKGGKFRIKRDLLKIYGMDSLVYGRLARYIRLPDHVKDLRSATPQKKVSGLAVRFDLNHADTTELKTIYGIGSRLARRIVTYREKLGGFTGMHQLREVYGLDSAVIHKVSQRAYIEESFNPSKININQASDKELSSHPYISIVIAKAIVAYRFQHGDFATVEDIRLLLILKKEEADKIIPYLIVSQ